MTARPWRCCSGATALLAVGPARPGAHLRPRGRRRRRAVGRKRPLGRRRSHRCDRRADPRMVTHGRRPASGAFSRHARHAGPAPHRPGRGAPGPRSGMPPSSSASPPWPTARPPSSSSCRRCGACPLFPPDRPDHFLRPNQPFFSGSAGASSPSGLGESAAPNFSKKSPASFLAVPSISRAPSWAILPPTSALAS